MSIGVLVISALRRKPSAVVLTFAATTAAYTLFGLMIGLYSTKRHMADSARMDEIFVNMRYPNSPYTGLPLSVGAQIARIKGVKSVGAYKWLGGYRSNQADQIAVLAVSEGMQGARPDAPVRSDQWRALFTTPSGVLITRDLAAMLNLKAGDTFPLTTNPQLRADGNGNWEFQVLAVIPDDPQFADGVILGNVSYIENAAPPSSSGLGYDFWISIVDASRAADISKAIDHHFENSESPTYSVPVKADVQDNIDQNIIRASMMLGASGAALFMILFLVANAVARSVGERLQEFAVLQSIGFRVSRIRCLVIMEAACPCFFGAVVGTACAAIITKIPAREMSPHFNMLVTTSLPIIVIAWAVASAIFLAFASSVFPLLRLSRVNVSDVLTGR